MKGMATAGALSVGLSLASCSPGTEPVQPRDDESVSFTATNGMTSKYRVYAADLPQPAGLLIWAHGDGAYEFDHPEDSYVMGGDNGVRAEAKAEGYIVVSALSPDVMGTITWWERGADNADYMADLIEHLRGEYDIDSTKIVLAGYSGGAQFFTQFFLPEYSSMLVGGGSIVFGGGGAPETPEQRPWNDDLIPNFFMHWATGSLDDAEHSDEDYDALGYAKEGVDYYSDLGFETSYDWIPGKGHEIDGLFGAIVGEQLRTQRN